MRDVASYILVSLQGTTPANPKAPEGELYVPEEAAEVDSSAVESASVVIPAEEGSTTE